ncbi:MAG TPA: ABC transporter permease [Microbacteriaceae bacterium]|nr:ABC transporter permease [Microbacteriaceae bacterium]
MTSTTAPRQARRPSRSGAIWRGVAGVLGLSIVLEIVSRSGIVDQKYLPPFSEVIVRSFTLWGDQQFRDDVASTLLTYLIGLGISIVIAVPLGALFGMSRPIYRGARAVIELLRPIPPVALIPLVLLMLGSGMEMKVVIVVFAAVWPIMFNTLYGVHDVDPYAKDMARSFGIGRFGIIRRIVIPSAAPFIMTGVRISSSIALIVVITVELIAGGAQGIGAYISRLRGSYNDAADTYLSVLAATIMAGLIGLLINLLIGWFERRFFGWEARDSA